MAIRHLRADDLDTIWRINQANTPEVGSVSQDELASIVDQSIISLAVDEGNEGETKVGGFCLVLPSGAEYGSQNYAWFSDRYDDFIYLDRIALAPSFRRRGFGRQLYGEVERLAAERRPSATVFALEVNLNPRNDPSLAFHWELGFEEVGIRTPNPEYSVSMLIKHMSRGVDERSDV